MRWRIVIAMLVALSVASMPVIMATAIADGNGGSVDLWAGQHTDVGDVSVHNDADFVYVTITTIDGWSICCLHVDAAVNLEDIPQSNGNPVPGLFTYSPQLDECVNDITVAIDNVWEPGTEIIIAVHACMKGECGCVVMLDEMCASLPEQTVFTVCWEGNDGIGLMTDSFMDVSVDYRMVPGYYLCDDMEQTCCEEDDRDCQTSCVCPRPMGVVMPGWCMEPYNIVRKGVYYDANVYCSTGSLPEDMLNQDNMDNINYLLNQHWVGTWVPELGMAATVNDVQIAIWNMTYMGVDLAPWITWMEGMYNEDMVAMIFADAMQNGDGFMPGCDDVVGILLDPVRDESQLVLVEMPLCYIMTCSGGEETAWAGYGVDSEIGQFPGNWAMYFYYTVTGSD